MTIVLISNVEQNVIDAEAKISANCNFPNGRGTDKWSDIFKIEGETPEQDEWYFLKPPEEGWTDGVDSFTQEQMMNGVINVEERDM